jgi:agmatine deiminase
MATPRELGYRMPAEWEPHEATWLSWPRRGGVSFPDNDAFAPALWVRMAAALSAGELVHLNVRDPAEEDEVRTLVAAEPTARADRIFVHRIPTDEPWARDHGPCFVVRDSQQGAPLAIVDWRYNAWGGKYPPWERDDAVPQQVAALLRVPAFSPGIVMEGGAIDVNGAGMLLTTESCLLNPNRNPQLGRDDIERYLRDYLGVTQVVWLGAGIVGDDTDGHVDDLTRFVAPRRVVTAVEDDPRDANWEPLRDNLARLRAVRDPAGEPLEVVELPMPAPFEREAMRLPASYANFYIGNAVVLVPAFRDPNDARAVETIARCFPDRRVVAVDAVDLVWGLGAFHCVTQQQPAVGGRVFAGATRA